MKQCKDRCFNKGESDHYCKHHPEIKKENIQVTLFGLALAALIGLGIWGICQAIDAFANYQPKTICVKSHTVDNSGYKYGFTIQGKMGFGYVIDEEEVCDKSIPNPQYKGDK
jgi:hypothetical protein